MQIEGTGRKVRDIEGFELFKVGAIWTEVNLTFFALTIFVNFINGRAFKNFYSEKPQIFSRILQ